MSVKTEEWEPETILSYHESQPSIAFMLIICSYIDYRDQCKIVEGFHRIFDILMKINDRLMYDYI